MNNIKSISKVVLPLLLVLLTVNLSMAQRGQRGNPEKRMEKQTEMMVEKLSLSTAQAEKVKEVNLNMAKKMQAIFENSEGDRASRRTAMEQIRAEHQVELKKYLTAEQFAEWEKIEEERRSNRPGRRGDRKRGNRSDRDQG